MANKPGHLSVRWTRKHEDTGPGTVGAKLGYPDQGDLLFSRGDGCSRADGSFLCWMFSSRLSDPTGKERTFAEELHARGYDLTTLRFSIKKAGGR